MTVQQAFAFERAFDMTAPPPPSRCNLVIEAGAGTGKTTAIVAEVLKLMVERDDLAPERIVLMTFTEKAAGEIADRIRIALEELATGDATSWPIDSPHPLVTITDSERARRAIAHHLENIDALRSQTIHSFCQSLLRTFPIEAGLDPQFKIIEGFERSLLYGQLYDAWLDEETRVHPTPEIVAEWELLFTHVGYLFQIRDVVLTLLDRRDLLEETGYDFGEFDEVREPLIDAIRAIRNCPDDAGDDAARRIFTYVRETPPPAPAIDAWIEYLQPIASSIRDANLPRHGVLKEALRILRAGDKGRSVHDRLVSHRAAMALLALTRRFIAFMDAEKRKLGVVDFDDLLLRTLALLDDPAVLSRARAQFDFIFVDEFQDTDRTQARIIDRLARDASGAYVPGRTIVVGDPKQSIYGFRRADPETYHRMTEGLVRGGAARQPLLDQYRSDAPLLDVVNAMFARLFPEEGLHDANVFRPPYRALTAARVTPRRDLNARVTMLHAQHDEKADRHRVEAEAIAEWIRANRDGGALDLQRFAILFRRLTKIDDYLDTFDRYGIEYVLPPTRLFLDRRAPVDLLAVLRAIAWPFDAGAQISAARTPYFALTDVEIANASTPWSDFTASIARFRDAATHLTVSSLIDLILDTTQIERVYDAAADGARHLRHLEHLRGIAFEYDQRIGGSARQFVDEITQRRGEPEEAEPSLVDDSKNAVRILSVHAAKGLEFDTVILPDLAFPTSMSETLQLFTVEEPRSIVLSGRADSISANFRFADGEKLKKIVGRREEAEVRRLFYVAVTRARTDVVFVCNFGEETKNAGFFKTLCESLECDRNALAALWPERGRELRETPIGRVAFERIEVAGAASRTRRRLRDAALEAELAAAEIVACEVPVPTRFIETLSAAEVAARRAGSRNRAAGILLHRVLELWDGRADVEPLLRQLAIETAADSDALARVRQRLATIARSPMLARIAAAETIGREVPVRFVENGVLVERRIDRLLREGERDLVLDYKSGQPEMSRIARDRAQVETYCAAISAITGRACGGTLWYIGLDSDEIVSV
ncbi:MAG TPA: UvrD-helicase domain-containing protein [Thermoanaerobaculia bacterium]|nr:UvrD-helicase domain-containing protein [Thermoanaerobaculia bacterium]